MSINLSEIDWTVLTPEDFSKLEADLQQSNLKTVKSKTSTQRISGNTLIEIHNKKYEIPKRLYLQIKNIKSEKSRLKLIDKIVSEYNPIEEL